MILLRKILLLFVFSLLSLYSFGQYVSAFIEVDGLTCSVCTRSAEMSIRKLDFVDSVAMDLSHTSGNIIFKQGSKVVIEKIAKAVTDAGFSVRSLHAVFNFDTLDVEENFCWSFENEQYQFLKTENKSLSGTATLKFIGEKYLPKKEFKKWSAILANAKGNGCRAKNVYYVTL